MERVAKMVVKNLFKLILSLIIVIALVVGAVKIYNLYFADKNPLKNENPPIAQDKDDEKLTVKTVKGYLAKNIDTSNSILIFDEAQNIKNMKE
jgi:hypothetical protein